MTAAGVRINSLHFGVGAKRDESTRYTMAFLGLVARF